MQVGGRDALLGMKAEGTMQGADALFLLKNGAPLAEVDPGARVGLEGP
jgi:hypothetical protein